MLVLAAGVAAIGVNAAEAVACFPLGAGLAEGPLPPLPHAVKLSEMASVAIPEWRIIHARLSR
jgi:hypothetical protein